VHELAPGRFLPGAVAPVDKVGDDRESCAAGASGAGSVRVGAALVRDGEDVDQVGPHCDADAAGSRSLQRLPGSRMGDDRRVGYGSMSTAAYLGMWLLSRAFGAA
jgi:hypothetical protein